MEKAGAGHLPASPEPSCLAPIAQPALGPQGILEQWKGLVLKAGLCSHYRSYVLFLAQRRQDIKQGFREHEVF